MSNLHVFIDSDIADDLTPIDKEAFDRLLAYNTQDLFHFRRSPKNVENTSLQKIPQYQKKPDKNNGSLAIELEPDNFISPPNTKFIESLSKMLYNKDSVSQKQTDLVFWILLNIEIMPFEKYNTVLFVTLHKTLRRNHKWQNSYTPKNFYVVDIKKAMEFMDLYAKKQDKYFFAPRQTMNKGYWYLCEFKRIIPHRHGPARINSEKVQVMDAFVSRFTYLLMTVDELGKEHYFPTDTHIMNPYYFNYFVILLTGIFDNLAIETQQKYNLQFQGMHIPSRTSLHPETGKYFLKALRESNMPLRDHIKKYSQFITLMYVLRELAIHRESFRSMGYHGKKQFLDFFVIDDNTRNLIKMCGDKPLKFDELSEWGILQELFIFLEPYHFSKTATQKLVNFVISILS